VRGHAEFDEFAHDYDAALNGGLSVSGEDKNYFARGRVQWLAARLEAMRFKPRVVLDYGCGTGSAAPFLLDLLKPEKVIGVDISERSVEVANKRFGSDRVKFLPLGELAPGADVDLVYCNGVFHHIPLAERPGAVSYVRERLRSQGLWAFWDNNPFNPGTQWIIYRLPFERDSITISAFGARKLLNAGGFEVLDSQHLFIFPRFLRWFRPLEKHLTPYPIGAQYQLLCRKP
jgi:SAM-dependent methyltransferase